MSSLNFPASPTDGQVYENFSYDNTLGVWKRTSGAGSASITVSDTAPANPIPGGLWLDSVSGNTYIYYEDADTSQWVQTSGPGFASFRNSEFFISSTAPVSPVDGDIWYDSSEGFTYIYYEDVDSSQWVQFGLNRNGARGADGTNGLDAESGSSFPLGGLEGQVLAKASNADDDVEWIDSTSGLETIKLNAQVLTENYVIPDGFNGLSAGPITIADGVTVTIPDGSAWSIV